MRTTLLAAVMVIATGSLIASCDSSEVPTPAPVTTEAPEPVPPPVATSESATAPPPPAPTTIQPPAPPLPPITPAPIPPVDPPDPPDPPADVYYKNCDAARAAGAAPLHRGEPGYRPALDRDDDGVACE